MALSSGSATRALPQRVLGRDLFWWLTETRLITAPVQSRLGRRFRNSGELIIGPAPGNWPEPASPCTPRDTAAGAPVYQRGVSPVPALYFLGLPWQHTRESAPLGFVGADAEHIAAYITPAPAAVPAA